MSTSYKHGIALIGAMLALTFTLVHPVSAGEEPRTTPPSTTVPAEPGSRDAVKSERTDCKKIYKWVHRGHPDKGVTARKLVRVECPIPRGA